MKGELKIRRPHPRSGRVVICFVVGIPLVIASCALLGKPPVAIVDASPLAGEAPLVVIFDGSQSFDPDGTIVTYSWNFNDGSPTASGQTASHKFQREGVFKVVLTVTDDRGNQDSDKVFITVGRSRLYFSSNRRTGSSFEIFRIDTDGNNPTQITTTSAPRDDVLPSLVPNTRDRLAFSSDRDSPGTMDIFTSSSQGTLLSNLTVTQTMSHEIQPSWSPDGAFIAFASNQTGSWEIYLMNSDGTGRKNLTLTSGGKSVAPAISPDGTHIAFAADCNSIAVAGGKASLSDCGNDFELFLMVLDANNDVAAASKLTSNTFNDVAVGLDLGPSGLAVTGADLGFGVSRPSWSPDGAKIAFAASPGATEDIFICSLNLVTHSCTTNSPLPNASDSGFREFDPHWFADSSGEWIAFVNNRPSGGVTFQIWKVKTDGTGLAQLTSLGTNVQPAGSRERK